MTDLKIKIPLVTFTLVLLLVAPILSADEMVLAVEPAQQAPEIDLAEILNDPKQTRQRLGWMAALQVGMVAGMYYLEKESRNQCRGSLCSALGISLFEDIQADMLRRKAVEEMAEVFTATVKSFDEAGLEYQAEYLATVLNARTGTQTIQIQMATATRNFVKATTDFAVLEPDDSESSPTHALKIGITEVDTGGNYVNAGLSIVLKGTAELVDLASGETVDSYSHLVKTPERKLVDWTAAGAGVIAQDVVLAMVRLVETLSEEVLMVVNSPSLKGKGYIMKPVAPIAKVCLAFCKGSMWGNFGFKSQVDTHTPSLSWEPFQDRYALDPLYPEAGDLQDVQYDLRIHEAVEITRVMGDKIYGAGPLLQEIRGVRGPEFTFEKPLPACTRLVWTVRARFVANDTRHLTRWSGHYKERQIERRRRDNLEGKGKFTDAMGVATGALLNGSIYDFRTGRQETSYYYGFRTPQ
ncbi:MAG: hypothetical protein O7F71_13210, partial [Gammaproteobacteria bacterium]|nr:hypothetical protein [Gammaproteobacteria bacterium]